MPKTLIDPFRIKGIEPIRIATRQECASIRDIVQEMFSYADGASMSANLEEGMQED
jgi:hypothetical protein